MILFDDRDPFAAIEAELAAKTAECEALRDAVASAEGRTADWKRDSYVKEKSLNALVEECDRLKRSLNAEVSAGLDSMKIIHRHVDTIAALRMECEGLRNFEGHVKDGLYQRGACGRCGSPASDEILVCGACSREVENDVLREEVLGEVSAAQGNYCVTCGGQNFKLICADCYSPERKLEEAIERKDCEADLARERQRAEAAEKQRDEFERQARENGASYMIAADAVQDANGETAKQLERADRLEAQLAQTRTAQKDSIMEAIDAVRAALAASRPRKAD